MGLRLFCDHCVPASIVESLRQAGHEVFRLRDIMPAESPDTEVIAKAQQLDSILISLDGDFADIVAYPPARFKGIIAIQMRNHPEATQALLSSMHSYLSLHSENDHYQGMLLIVEPSRVRSRR